jgi:hypothetical protein
VEHCGEKVNWAEHAVASKKLRSREDKEVITLTKGIAEKSLLERSINCKLHLHVVSPGLAREYDS